MPRLHWCCPPDDDLFRAARRGRRHDTPAAAIAAAPSGGAALILAGAPALTDADLAAAKAKGLRLYVEQPPGPTTDHPPLNRAVVAPGKRLTDLPPLALLGLPARKLSPIPNGDPWLVSARVAGYDVASFGLPAETIPLLVETQVGGCMALVSATGLSDVVRARFGPVAHWQALWSAVLAWLDPTNARPVRWTPAAAPSFRSGARLPARAEARALRRGIDWLFHAKMVVHPDQVSVYDGPAANWPDRVGPRPGDATPAGDGSHGVLEGMSSRIDADGSQPVRWWRRADCCGETAGSLALAASALDDPALASVGERVGDWLLERSILTGGKRARPSDPAYGLIGWNDVTRYYGDMDGYGVYYADDMSRCTLGLLAARAALSRERWDERLAQAILATLRLTSTAGFVPDRVDEGPFERGGGWEPHFRGGGVSLSPHYQGYTHALFLRAFALSGERVFLERARAGLKRLVETHPAWNCANGSLSLEEARILLPLAWLVRADDTPEHRAWLTRFVAHFSARQDASGFPGEALANPRVGVPQSNAEYGVAETSLLQRNGDPVADLLYTANFAAIGLHEAAALGIAGARAAADRLTRGLVRAQVAAPGRPQLDGAWFRAFDFKRGEFWASNADAGWGAWATETGWTQSWICMVLSLRARRTTLWERTAAAGLGDALRRWRPVFVSDPLLRAAPASPPRASTPPR